MKQNSMKFLIAISLFSFFSGLTLQVAAQSKKSPIKVACVGNSITYGTGMPNREKNSYPAQLQSYLGDEYEVRNFGQPSTTLVSGSKVAYIKGERFQQSLAFQPDIVFIKLGTNDSKAIHWEYLPNFKNDYKELINAYRNLPSKPRIILLAPIHCFMEGNQSVCDSVLKATIIPAVQKIAKQEKLEYINLYNIFGNRWRQYLVPDKLHPSPMGAGVIAKKLYQHLARTKAAPGEYKENLCMHPVCGNEYRGAGWTKGHEWHSVSEDINNTLKGRKLDVLFLGNSITQGLAGKRKAVKHNPGLEIANSTFSNWDWETAGIAGDRTQNLLWRILHNEYEKSSPKNVIITIGINNLKGGDDPQEVAEAIHVIGLECKKRFKRANIIVLGLFPAGLTPDTPIRKKCNSVHEFLAKYQWDGIRYINPSKWFTQPDGTLKKELYAKDHLHLITAGYGVWCTNIKKIITDKK